MVMKAHSFFHFNSLTPKNRAKAHAGQKAKAKAKRRAKK